MDVSEEMIKILERIGLNPVQINNFIEQKISPDIVSCLSLYEFQCLGVTDKSDIMKLRVECVAYKRINATEYRGRCDISKQTIEHLLESGFHIADASKVLSVSESTLYRKMRQFNISKLVFTEISDSQLDEIVTDTLQDFPNSGEKMLWKVLQGKGIKVFEMYIAELNI
jgi:hypothetical protein